MATLIRRGRIANASRPETGEVLRLEPADDPAAVAHRLGGAARVEVNFPSFTDGRGYSIARLLRDGLDAEESLRALQDFSEAYQASVERPEPLFRRR